MARAELAEAQELLAGPTAAEGVVRVAEQEELGLRCDGGLHGLPIEGRPTVLLRVRHGDEVAVRVLMAMQHGRVSRGADHNGSVRGRADRAGHQGEGRYTAGQVVQPAGLHLRPVAVLQVVHNGLPHLVREDGVAVEMMIEPTLQSPDDAIRRLNIHIGDTEGDRPLEVPLTVPGVATLLIFCKNNAHISYSDRRDTPRAGRIYQDKCGRAAEMQKNRRLRLQKRAGGTRMGAWRTRHYTAPGQRLTPQP